MENFWIDIYNTNKGYTYIDEQSGRDINFWHSIVKSYDPKNIEEAWVNIDHVSELTAGNLLAIEMRADGKIWGLIEPNEDLEWYINNNLVKYRSIEFVDELKGFGVPYMTGLAFLTSKNRPASKGLSRLKDVLFNGFNRSDNNEYDEGIIYKHNSNKDVKVYRSIDFEPINFDKYIINNNINNQEKGGIDNMSNMIDTNNEEIRKQINILNEKLAQIEKEKIEQESILRKENEEIKLQLEEKTKQVNNIFSEQKRKEIDELATNLIEAKKILPRSLDAGFKDLCFELALQNKEIEIRKDNNQVKANVYDLFKTFLDSLPSPTDYISERSNFDLSKMSKIREDARKRNNKFSLNVEHPDYEYGEMAKTIIEEANKRGEEISYTKALEQAIKIINNKSKEVA